jgi:pyruvate formate-lyase activating enzyme-like uncharacterized protein
MLENLNPELAKIYEQVQGFEPEESNLQELQSRWDQHLSAIKTLVPEVYVDDSGETVLLGELSAGCQACKDGTWDCIFVTMGCNLACEFCYSPHAIDKGFVGSVFGLDPEQIVQKYEKILIQGISFSGGEPFLEKERLFEWVSFFTSRFPEKYYWLYTNGLLASKQDFKRLRELGVDEIRFNVAATGYDHPIVMENISTAASYLPNVTIEIPAIPEHRMLVLENLVGWSRLGVRFLNLHELIYEPLTNAANMAGSRRLLVNIDGHSCEFNPQSRSLTLEVMERVSQKDLPLSVNDCSMQNKLRQLRYRRRNIAMYAKEPHEKFVEGYRYETCYAYQGEDYFFLHPDHLDEMRHNYPDYHFIKLTRIAPLSFQEKPKWISFEWIP